LEGHNAWINVLGQVGAIGMVAFVWLLWTLLQPLRRAHPPHDPRLSLLRLGVGGGVVGAVFYHGLFAANEESRHLWPLLGLMASLPQYRTREKTDETEPIVPRQRADSSSVDGALVA